MSNLTVEGFKFELEGVTYVNVSYIDSDYVLSYVVEDDGYLTYIGKIKKKDSNVVDVVESDIDFDEDMTCDECGEDIEEGDECESCKVYALYDMIEEFTGDVRNELANRIMYTTAKEASFEITYAIKYALDVKMRELGVEYVLTSIVTEDMRVESGRDMNSVCCYSEFELAIDALDEVHRVYGSINVTYYVDEIMELADELNFDHDYKNKGEFILNLNHDREFREFIEENAFIKNVEVE